MEGGPEWKVVRSRRQAKSKGQQSRGPVHGLAHQPTSGKYDSIAPAIEEDEPVVKSKEQTEREKRKRAAARERQKVCISRVYHEPNTYSVAQSKNNMQAVMFVACTLVAQKLSLSSVQRFHSLRFASFHEFSGQAQQGGADCTCSPNTNTLGTCSPNRVVSSAAVHESHASHGQHVRRRSPADLAEPCLGHFSVCTWAQGQSKKKAGAQITLGPRAKQGNGVKTTV